MSGVLDWIVWPWLQNLLVPALPPAPTVEKLDVTRCTEGAPVPEILGTVSLSGNVLWYGYNRSKKIKENTSGKGGDSMPSQTVGFKYFLTWAVGLCVGPVDALYAVRREDKVVYKNASGLARPGSGGAETVVLDGMDGNMTFYYGTTDQTAPSRIGDKVGATLNPPYRRFCWAYLHDLRIGRANRAPAMSFTVGHWPTLAFNANETIGYDYNPAHALYYVLVNLAGVAAAAIDETSFSAAADTLYSESRGISLALDRSSPAASHCEEILRHADGMLYLTEDGKIGLRLLRADIAVGSLPEFTDADWATPPRITRPDTPDLYNEIKASFLLRRDPTSSKAMLYKDAAIGVRNIASIRAAGARSKSVSFPLFTTQANAEWAAGNQLRTACNPLAKGTVTARRAAFRLQPGDAFRFTSAALGIDEMVVRVTEVSEGELENGEEIELSFYQDPYYLGTQATVSGGSLGDEDTTEIEALEDVVVIELPWVDGSEPGRVAALCGRKAGIETGFELYVSADGSSYSSLGKGSSYCVYGTLYGNHGVGNRIDDGATGITVTITSEDVDQIETIERAAMIAFQNLAWLDGEFVSFETVTPLGSDRYRLTGIQRGLWDTEPTAHADGADFYFIGAIENLDRFKGTLLAAGATRYFKAIPYTEASSGALADATAVTLTLTDRARLPYPISNLLAGGTDIRPTYTSDIVLTWRTRVRGDGAGVGGEDGVTDAAPTWEGTFEIEVAVGGSTVRTVTGLDDDTWTYTSAMNTADNGSLASTVTLRVRGAIDQNHKSAWTTITVLKA
jgi:hypothetical protein